MNLKQLKTKSTEPDIKFEDKKTTKTEVIQNDIKVKPAKSKKLVIVAVLGLLLIAVISTILYSLAPNNLLTTSFLNNSQLMIDAPNLVTTPTPTPMVKLFNPINGLEVERSVFDAIKSRPVLAVMVQNNIASRPPYGLNEADLVYETLVESGITRFMAVYWQNNPSRVQSIRSSRKYFVDLLGEYNNPSYMHIGYATGATNVDALAAMGRYRIRRVSDSTDQTTKELAFSRDKECQKIKAIEHCAWTDTNRLWRISEQLGYKGDITQVASWKYLDPSSTQIKELTIDDIAPSKVLSKESFDIDFRVNSAKGVFNDDYSVRWAYDPASTMYSRYDIGAKKPFLDNTGAVLTTKTVIVQKIKSRPSGDDKGHQVQEVFGSGSATIMENGIATEVSWEKKDFNSKTRYFDALTGKDYEFQRGRKWVMLVPDWTVI